MRAMLTPGESVRLQRHQMLGRIGELLGMGGQGEVYRLTVQSGSSSQELALKWYYPQWAAPAQFQALVRLVEQGPPSTRFLWPIDVAVSSSHPGFGYLMPLRSPGYVSCLDIMTGRREIAFREVIRTCLQLSDCFLRLHAMGLCYRDISFGNIFVDPGTGDTLVADNDNVAVEGEAQPGIRGTRSFMAPEVMCRTALPSAMTDLHSLAVLLFYLLIMHHPLEGRRLAGVGVLGPEEALTIYGTRPLFIFDPLDDSNAPDPVDDANALQFWPLYPDPVRELFTQAFTDGLHHPHERVRESQWRDCMAQLLDLMVPCRCGADVFLQLDGGPVAPCWGCGTTHVRQAALPRLVLDPEHARRVVTLYPGKQLHAHHIGEHRFDYQVPLARVERHPDADLVGLRNLGTLTWTASADGDERVAVPPRRALRIAPGTAVRFGPVDGVFVA